MVRAYPGFHSVKHAQEYCYFPPWTGCYSIPRLPPSSMSPVPIYTPGWRESKRIRVPCLRKQHNRWGLNTRAPDQEFEVLTTRPYTSPLRKKILTNFPLDIFYDQALHYPSISIWLFILVWTNGQTCKDSWYHNQCFSYSRQSNQHHHPVSLLS